MDLTAPTGATLEAVEAMQGVIRESRSVALVGTGTHSGVGGDVRADREVRGPAASIRHDPADLTVTVSAGTEVGALDAELAIHGQECALDPSDPGATVGGALACGLSGHRRLRHGPIRDRVLEVRFLTGDGRLVKGGGPTVKNVSGYDLPRLLVGSLGTLGVIVQATLRCTPRSSVSQWSTGTADPFAVRSSMFRPSCVAWDGTQVWCLLEGHQDDVMTQRDGAGLAPSEAPPWPIGGWRGRIAVRPASLRDLGPALAGVTGLRWIAEVGVGTVHAAADAPEPIEAARALAHDHGGWLLREEGIGVDPFGRPLPNVALMRRLKDALDPEHKLNPGRLPL
ncbi:MAG TPA: FAD-binding protein [Acidimicrobiia bacterium]|nr:FAD-binding protein [Acidimicrobiia bacterium]